jgi:hypothetical protein
MPAASQDCIDVIRCSLQGEPTSAICRALGRTRYWLYKWLKRYDPTNALWAKDHPRAPIGSFPRLRGLVDQPTYRPRGTPYSPMAALRPTVVHQLALVGPRDLKGEALLGHPSSRCPQQCRRGPGSGAQQASDRGGRGPRGRLAETGHPLLPPAGQ